VRPAGQRVGIPLKQAQFQPLQPVVDLRDARLHRREIGDLGIAVHRLQHRGDAALEPGNRLGE